MGWVTLDDGQHVYIGSSGRVLATRAPISSGPGGGKERGKALAARSKAAIGKATGKGKPSLKEQADKARAAKGDREERALKLTGRAQAKAYQLKKQGNEQAAKIAEGHAGKAYRAYLKPKLDAAFKKTTQQSPATTRAIEHAKAEGEQFKLIQRSAIGSKAPVNTGKGVTKFMFDMKRGDKRGQTSFLK